jgi:hypothetical protein
MASVSHLHKYFCYHSDIKECILVCSCLHRNGAAGMKTGLAVTCSETFSPEAVCLFCWAGLESFWQQSGCEGRALKERLPVPVWQKFCLRTGDKSAFWLSPANINSSFSSWTVDLPWLRACSCPSGGAWSLSRAMRHTHPLPVGQVQTWGTCTPVCPSVSL